MADRAEYPGMPRWVKITGIALLVILLIAFALVALGIGGPHGPGRHGGAAQGGEDAGASSAGRDEASVLVQGARVTRAAAHTTAVGALHR
ncbi:MAG TPA: hypothetical protein VFH78_12815 [Candidatus Thermoplasmatota archaeon]|nr:hypothetical protein [Candidatus Thermoplasmatota archaeon]